MCGLAMFYATESVPDYKHLDTLFSWSENRGTDGFGLVLINNNRRDMAVYKNINPYSQCKNEVQDYLKELKIGDVIIAISRAAPETEINTRKDELAQTLQPVVWKDDGLVVVHNGAVTNQIHQELKTEMPDKFISKIDSESILASYVKHQRNPKMMAEYLSGGYAAIMYDQKKDFLYFWTDFKNLCQAYIKGTGYFLASEIGCVDEIVCDITSCRRDGINLWESWYHHYLSGQRIKELDLQSNFVRNIKYSPRFMTQTWDSNAKGQ